MSVEKGFTKDSDRSLEPGRLRLMKDWLQLARERGRELHCVDLRRCSQLCGWVNIPEERLQAEDNPKVFQSASETGRLTLGFRIAEQQALEWSFVEGLVEPGSRLQLGRAMLGGRATLCCGMTIDFLQRPN